MLVCDAVSKPFPQPIFDAVAQTSHETFEGRTARQKYLVRQQPGRCTIKQDAGLLGAGPAQGIEPPAQPETDGGIAPIAETVSRSYLCRVFPSLVSTAIARQLIKIRELQLSCEGLHDRVRHLHWVFEKRAEKAGGGELKRKAQPIVIATLDSNYRVIRVIQMEIAQSTHRRSDRQRIDRMWCVVRK